MDAPLLPEPDRLDRLVTLLDAACADGGWHQPHRLLFVEDRPDDSDAVHIGCRELEEDTHPLDHLLGFAAPASWSAMGLVCFGWSAPADGVDAERNTTSTRPSVHPDRRRVRVVSLLDRTGVERCTATVDDGTVIDEPGAGTVSDALRRCLGLATAPPPVGTAEVFAALWLSSIASMPAPASWAHVARLHPAMALLDAGGHRPQAAEIVAAGRSLHRSLGWNELRLRAASGRGDHELAGVPPDVAAWMDDGMFARWVLGGLPPLPVLLAECAAVQSPDVVRRIRRALRGWNLDPPMRTRAA